MLQIYLESSNLVDYLKNFNFEEINFTNFIGNIVNSSTYTNILDNKFLIENKEKIEKYYILISGKAKHIRHIKTFRRMIIKEFFMHLIQLQRKGDNAYRDDIEENKKIINIDISDLERINYLLFLEELKYNLFKCRTKYSDIIKIFNDYCMNLHQYDIDMQELNKFNMAGNFQQLSEYCRIKLKNHFDNEINLADLYRFKINCIPDYILAVKNNLNKSNVDISIDNLNNLDKDKNSKLYANNINLKKYKFTICEKIDLDYIPINYFISEEIITDIGSEEITNTGEIFDSQDKENNSDEDPDKNLNITEIIKIPDKAVRRNSSNTREKNKFTKSKHRESSCQVNNNTNLISGRKSNINLNNLSLFSKNNDSKLDINSSKRISVRNFIEKDLSEDDYTFSKVSILCETKCEFLGISKEEFEEFFQQEKQKMKNKELSFLSDNYFFSSINKKVFEKKYFSAFKSQTYTFETVLFKENDVPEKLFLLKEGIIEITLNKNILELTTLIKNLIKLEPSLKNAITNDSEFKANNQLKNILEDLAKKRKFSLFKYDSRDIIGIESVFLSNNYFFNATVISRKAQIYELNLSTLRSINKETQEIIDNFKNISLDKLNSFIKRSIYLKNIFLRNFDSRVTNEQIKIKMYLCEKKHEDKLTEINNNNPINIISKEHISIDKYNKIKEMLLNKEGIYRNYNRDDQSSKYKYNYVFNNKNNNNITENKYNTTKNKNCNIFKLNKGENNQDVELNDKSKNEKIVVVNNLYKDNKTSTNNLNTDIDTAKTQNISVIIENNRKDYLDEDKASSSPNPNFMNQELNLYQEAKLKNSEEQKVLNFLTTNKIKEKEIQAKKLNNIKNNNYPNIEKNSPKIFNNNTVNNNTNRRSNNSSMANSQIESNNLSISIANIESKKRDFEVLIFGERNNCSNSAEKNKALNYKNSEELIKYYKNLQSVKKNSLNLKMDEFFKEGVQVSTKAFENGSFFVTSNNSEDKTKWNNNKLTKKFLKEKKIKKDKIRLDEIDNYIEKDVKMNHINFLTSPIDVQNVEYVTPKTPFILKRMDLPIIKKIKYENEHKKFVEDFVLKKNKRLKIVDDKVISVFKSVDDKKINVLSFENPNFLGENNDYLLPKNSQKSENIKEFYRMLNNKNLKSNKMRQQPLMKNEGS